MPLSPIRRRISLTTQFLSLFFFCVALPLIGVFATITTYLVQKTRLDKTAYFKAVTQGMATAIDADLNRIIARVQHNT